MIRGEDYIPTDARYSWPFELEAQEKALSALVDEFAVAMKEKLIAKLHEGYCGWDDSDLVPILERKLSEHIGRGPGQRVDAANLAAMLWNIERA